MSLSLIRPFPPEVHEGSFAPAPELGQWVLDTFLNSQHGLYNEDHEYLGMASIGFLWAFTANKRAGKEIIGTAERFKPKGDKWQMARQEEQIKNYFLYLDLPSENGGVPDFIITLDASYCDEADNASFCALVEHELYHCSYKQDEYGSPIFMDESGKPQWSLRMHDVEEFVGVVARYGMVSPDVRRIVEAANRPPLISQAALISGCGICSRSK